VPGVASRGYAKPGTALLAALAGLLLLAVFLAASGYLNSAYFRERMRRELVFALHSFTAGAVEIGSVQWRPSRLELTVDNLTIHGLEAAGEPPYAHVDHLRLRLKILSLLQRRILLRELSLSRPMIHILVYADGHTNQPALLIGGNRNPVQSLFNWSLERLEIDDGWLLWNQRRLPLDFSADDFSLTMSYVRDANRYDAQLSAGKLQLLTANYQLRSAEGQAGFSLHPDHLTLNWLRVSTARSRLEAKGTLTNWNDPVLTAFYKVSADTSEAAAMLTPFGTRAAPASPLGQFSGGELEVTAKGVFSRQSFTSSGKAIFKGVTWTTGPLVIGNLTGGLEFSADSESIAVPHLFASVLGGSLTGQAEITHWQVAAAPSGMAAADDGIHAKNRANGGRYRANGGRYRANGGRYRANGGFSRAAEEQGSASFVLRALSVKQLSASLPRRARESLNLSGRVSGKIAILWRGSPEKADTRFNLDVAQPPLVAPGEIPLSAHLEASYSGSRRLLAIATLSASSQATRLQASGHLGGVASNLRFAINTGSFGEIQPLLAQLPVLPKTLPIESSGAVSISGTVSGTFSAPLLEAHLELRDFITDIPRGGEPTPDPALAIARPPQRVSRMLGALSAFRSRIARSTLAPAVPMPGSPTRAVVAGGGVVDEPAPLRLHWDEAQADVFYSPQSISLRHAKLRRGPSEIVWEGGASLLQGQFVESSQLHGHVQVRGGELADLQSIIGTNYPIHGKLNTALQLDGTRRQLNGSGHLTLANLVAYGYPVRLASADLKFEGSALKIQNLFAADDRGKLTGGGEYNFSGKQFSFLLHGADFQLERVRQLQIRRLHIQGSLGFDAQGSGTAEAPVINATLRLRDLVVNGERIGDCNAVAVTQGAELTLTARSAPPNAALALDANIHLRGEMPMQAKLVAGNLVLDPWIKNFFPAGHAAHAVLDGEILLRGAARSPLSLSAEVKIPRVEGELEGIPIRNAGPILVHLRDQVVTVDQFRLEGQQTHFVEIHGQLHPWGDQRSNLDADGRIDLKLAQTLAPELSSRGVADLTLRIRGTISKPSLSGQVRITEGAVSYIDLPNGLSDINGVLAFSQDRLQVRELTAVTGGGRLKLGGSVSYTQQITFNLTAEGRDIRLRYPEGVSSSVDASLAFSGTTGNALLSGEVTVSRLALNPRFDFASYLSKSQMVSTPANPKAPANNVKLDVRVVSTPQLQVQTSLARVTGNVDLHIRGSAARPSVLGRISILEGNLTLAGTTYRLDRGDISFTNPVSIDANIDIAASARVRDYDITLGLQGTLSRMNMTYRSDPPLSSSDIISLLALGRTREEEIAQLPGATLPGASTLAESPSTAILGDALNSAVNSRLQKLFGVSRIKLDPNVAGQQSGANARLTIEQTVSNRVTLTYITNLTQSAQQILQFEYYITPRISIVGVRDQNGVVSFDVFVRRRKR
jgi:translocation and assembly module TamB